MRRWLCRSRAYVLLLLYVLDAGYARIVPAGEVAESGKMQEARKNQQSSSGENPVAKEPQVYDCAIIGGGPAGLSAAVYMGRMRRSVIVIDDREGRSTWHQVNRNYLGFPDGIHASKLREVGREQVEKYDVTFLSATAKEVQAKGEGRARRFHFQTTNGAVVSRTVILATGVDDHFPDFEGSMECIGKTIFWCIICDGYETIDKRVVVLG